MKGMLMIESSIFQQLSQTTVDCDHSLRVEEEEGPK